MKLIKKVIFVLFLIFLFSSLLKNIFNYQGRLQFYQDYKKDYENERRRQRELQTAILKKKSAQELEKTIRNKLNLLKADEVAILLPSPTPPPATITPSSLPNWVKWWQVFFK
jgi:cell division protein FtsB